MSDDDSCICSSHRDRTTLRRAIISSDSESEPSPGCSSWTDQPSKSPRKVENKSSYRRITFNDSDSDSEEELELEDRQTLRRSSRLRNSTGKKTSEDEENDKEEEPIRRSQRNKVSAEKAKKLKIFRRLEAKRAGKRLSDDDSNENEKNSDAPTPPPQDDSESSSYEEESSSSSYEKSYRIVADPIDPLAKYSGKCRLPGCPDIFEIGVTKIIGVYFYDDPGQEKPAWICARHKYDDYEKIAKQNMELDESERTKSDDEFIDDTEEGDDSNSVESDAMEDMDEIKKSLRRERREYLKNTKKYMRQLGKYQLEVHSPRNKSLYTSPKKRYNRNARGAYIDAGMKDGSERSDPSLEFKLLKTQKKKDRKKQSKLSQFYS